MTALTLPLPTTVRDPEVQQVLDWLAAQFPIQQENLADRHHGMVSELPVAARPNDRCTYKADPANGVYWELVYDGVGELPWKKIGGPPLAVRSDEQRNLLNKTVYESLPVDPLALTLPLKGDYDVRVESLIAPGLAAATGQLLARVSYSIGATAAEDKWGCAALIDGAAAERVFSDVGKTTRQVGMAAATKIEEKAKTGGNYECAWSRRRLFANAVRVG